MTTSIKANLSNQMVNKINVYGPLILGLDQLYDIIHCCPRNYCLKSNELYATKNCCQKVKKTSCFK